jgi:hypothetical protein
VVERVDAVQKREDIPERAPDVPILVADEDGSDESRGLTGHGEGR